MNTHGHQNTIEAGAKHKVSVSRQNRRAICEYVANCEMNGATDEDILRNCPSVNTNALRLRLAELSDTYKFITGAVGERRKNSLGNNCRVWHVTASGLTALSRPLTDFHIEASR